MAKYITRFGAMRLLGVFSFPDHTPLRHGTNVIIRTNRGQENGVVLCSATPESVQKLGEDIVEDRVVRIMTDVDFAELKKIRNGEKGEFERCRNIVERMQLAMDLVRIEHLFGGERIIVYYVADGRIDFRELVKVLAAEFQTRIEMRQIGVRDETKLLADFGDCGKEVCCNCFLTEMPPVSMKMAKLQKATLDPTKISGRCGRLKCCLRYEYDTYVDIQRKMPGIGKRVTTPDGEGKVISQEILADKIWVELADRTRKLYSPVQVTLIAGQQHSDDTQENGNETGSEPA